MRPRLVPRPRPFLVAPLAAAAALLACAPGALATFPGHNGRIAFHSATATEGRQIFTVRPNGRDLRQITHVAGDAINADWSPDGRRIAFTSDRHVKRGKGERWGPDFELYLMRVNGTRIRRLTRNSVPDLVPDWQPIPR